MSSATALSQNDRAVLGALFDPEASLTANTVIVDQPAAENPSSHIPPSVVAAEEAAIRLLDSTNPSEQDVKSAIAELNIIVANHPKYASAYANRAQAYRLLPDSGTDTAILSDILTDLDTAISLSSPLSPVSPVSKHDATVLSQAHTHRGYLLLRASTSDSQFEQLNPLQRPLLQGVAQRSQLEELASKDFSIAGRYGNKVAQQLAVKTNPYAKLCGQIVKEALQREIKEYYEGEVVTTSA
ncbi:hypothetical protein LTR64_004118 [Lithohypha guttulata]|uniref:uncharacterized protein n=1 Tax=Lithohypha guttulata TaxID=1690604 RepID=UPI002DE0E3AB|nr:hypothetical protein LTR51_006589 [Lithohypha guttulata]